jgi:unsaturated chondroitin disaccharide hydrolase
MVTQKIILEKPERFLKPHTISKSKLEAAAEKACERLANMAKSHYGLFPSNWSTDFKYKWERNNNWVSGMYTGCFWLAYELTGDKFFREVAESHLDSYKVRLDARTGLMGHDVGFPYMPSCAVAYMITGNEYAKKIALDTAEFFYGNGYEQREKFKYIKTTTHVSMMDTMMNAFLFLWAGKETQFNRAIDDLLTALE